eukprot:748354-Hanusia_phi.AAC.3
MAGEISFDGPLQGVMEVSLGPDGRRIAETSKSGGRAWVWEVETGRGQELEGPATGVEGLSWGPDGMSLLTFWLDGSVKTWNPSDDGFFLLSSDFSPLERPLTCSKASISHDISSDIGRLLEKRGAVVQQAESKRSCTIQ